MIRKVVNRRFFRGSENTAKLASQPFFSIIITTYNRALILKKALDSLISQTESDWKAIIIDDESIDDNQYVPDRFNFEKKIYLSECVIGGTFFIERSVIFRLGGFNKIMLGADADLFDRAAEAGILMKELRIPTYIYHHDNEDSITNMLTNDISDLDTSYPDYITQ